MKNNGLVSSLVLATILAVGFLAVWGIVGMMAIENGIMIALHSGERETLILRADGTPLIAHSRVGATSYRALDGTPVTLEDDATGSFRGSPLPASLPWRKEDGDWEQRVRVFTDGRSAQTAWYFITDGQPDGKAYFVGYDYDGHSKERVGYLGTAGFRAELPPVEEQFPFSGATAGSRSKVVCPRQYGEVRTHRRANPLDPNLATPALVYVMGLDHKVYEADLRHRAVHILLHQQGLRSLAEIEDVTDPKYNSWMLAVRTEDAVLVLDKHGKQEQRYPIPEELREKQLTFGEATTGEAVMRWEKETDVMDEEGLSRLFWVRPDGRSRTAAVTLPQEPFRELRYLMGALLPAPLALEVLGVSRSQQLHEDGVTPSFASALGRTFAEFWPSALLAQVLAAGLAGACYRRQRRYGVGRTEQLVWPLFILLLGLPGWIGYRFGRKWPVLETCPECSTVVPRDRDSCLCCVREFPQPVLKGTELYA